MTIYGEPYARVYDATFRDKNYEHDCEYLETAFQRHAMRRPERILDLGAGTGTHALILGKRGYQVTCVDRSAAMLAVAQAKASAAQVDLETVVADLRDVNLGVKFDVVLSMFTVLGYMVETSDVLRAFASARRHLRPGGLLIFDVAYGPAVLGLQPRERTKIVRADGHTVIRLFRPTLLEPQNAVDVDLEVYELDADRVVAHSTERHVTRYFFQPELRHYLTQAGFEAITFDAFPVVDRPPDNKSWYVGCIAIARDAAGAWEGRAG